ncbi:MAG: YqjF family protein [Acidimicrobiia bacterium]
MAGNRPEEQVAVPVALQTWRHVTFLHWAYRPDDVQRLLPPGLSVDLVDGHAWVGLTPFSVEAFRVPGLPPLPIVSQFPETNLRTYVRGPNGKEGLWFLSIDVESLLMVLGARLPLGVPYLPADMRVEAGETLVYQSRRLIGDAHHRIEVRPGEPAGDLPERDALLIGRWRAFTRRAGRLLEVPVEHEPWPVHAATLVALDESVTRAAGLPPPQEPPLVHYAPCVHARLGLPRLV